MIGAHYKIMKHSRKGLIFNDEHFMNKDEIADRIITEVAAYKQVRKSMITSSSRKAIYVICRRVIAYVLHERVGMSYERIGAKLGNRNHTTTRHACEFLKDRWDYLSQFPTDKDLLDHLNRKLRVE